MMWAFAIVIVLALGAVALVASSRAEPLPEASKDRVDALVPVEGSLGAGDLRRVRFPVVVRGYRMEDVDALLERLASDADAAQAAPDVEPDGAPVPPPGPDRRSRNLRRMAYRRRRSRQLQRQARPLRRHGRMSLKRPSGRVRRGRPYGDPR